MKRLKGVQLPLLTRLPHWSYELEYSAQGIAQRRVLCDQHLEQFRETQPVRLTGRVFDEGRCEFCKENV